MELPTVLPKTTVSGFSDYFKTVLPSTSNTILNLNDYCFDTLAIHQINEDSVLQILRKVKNYFLLKGCVNILAYPLYLIFNLILKTSTLSDIYKTGRVTTIYKKR